MEFIAGVESELSAQSVALTIQLVESVQDEIAVYRRWWGEHRVDGVLMVDLRVDDPRVGALASLGLPAVVVGGPVAGGKLPATWHDEASAVVEAVRYLAALGHERIAQVAGVEDFVHTRERTRTFRAVVEELGLVGEIVEHGLQPRTRRARRPGSCSRRRRARPRSSSTATSSRSPGSASRATWGSPCPTTCRS